MAELWPGGPLTLPHEFYVDEHRIVVPELPTTTVLSWLAVGSWWELFPGAVDPLQMWPLTLRWHDDDDPLDYEHLFDIATTLLGRLTGLATPDGATDGYWPGRRLAATALLDWPSYAAWCATHGTDPLNGPLYRVMPAIYAWLRDRAGDGNHERLDHQIFGPPPHTPLRHINGTPDRVDDVPRHIRDQEAALALAALRETLPGEDRTSDVPEWTPRDQRPAPLP